MLRKVFIIACASLRSFTSLILVCTSISNISILLDGVVVRLLVITQPLRRSLPGLDHSRIGTSIQSQITVRGFQHLSSLQCSFENLVRQRFLLLLSGEGDLLHCYHNVFWKLSVSRQAGARQSTQVTTSTTSNIPSTLSSSCRHYLLS